jgi:endonuclease/exonuclease/phosphatase family metal-dependent hydrolase
MSGMAGNKGAVAIRVEYGNTSICFVTAHLAAGFANYEERNRDYKTISHGLKFQRNRSIEDHDTVIWLGDFNYRIGLSNEKVQRLCHVNDLETMYENDQVSCLPTRTGQKLISAAESANGRWFDFPILLRSTHHLSTYLQVRPQL